MVIHKNIPKVVFRNEIELCSGNRQINTRKTGNRIIKSTLIKIYQKYSYILIVAVFIAAILFASCCQIKFFNSSKVCSTSDAGSVLLSVNSICRWELVADTLQPKFNLASGDDALLKVMPDTSFIQQMIYDSFGLTGAVGLPQSFSELIKSKTQSSSGTTSSQEISEIEKETTKSGDVPDVSSSSQSKSDTSLPVSPGSKLEINPLVQYRAAASLYQAVQLINREVELVSKRDSYIPYMVRMQLTTMPYQRHLPYDIYATAEFFPSGEIKKPDKSNQSKLPDEAKEPKKLRLPYVVPLIVTDDLEQAVNSRATEVARQLGLALNLMIKNIGANVGSNMEKINKQSVLAGDINSLLTIARLNDNGIYIRLGAANEATSGYSMVGRTYDISLLILVPDEYDTPKEDGTPPTPQKNIEDLPDIINGMLGNGPTSTDSTVLDERVQIPIDRKTNNLQKDASVLTQNKVQEDKVNKHIKLSIITHTELRDAFHGKPLKERSKEDILCKIDNAFDRTFGIKYPEMNKAWINLGDGERLMIGTNLINYIQTSDYNKFCEEACKLVSNLELSNNLYNNLYYENSLSCINQGYLRSLWCYLASVMVNSSTKSASVELPDFTNFPDIVIPSQVAVIRDDSKDKAEVVLSDVSGVTKGSVSAMIKLVKEKGGEYKLPPENLSYNPELRTLSIQFPSLRKYNFNDKDVDNPKSCLVVNYKSKQNDKWNSEEFKLLCISAISEKPKPGFSLRTTSNEIVSNAGAGTIKLVIDDLKEKEVFITWNGADVLSAKNSKGVPVEINFEKITISKPAVLTLKLNNAKPGNKVIFTAIGSDSKADNVKEFQVIDGKSK